MLKVSLGDKKRFAGLEACLLKCACLIKSFVGTGKAVCVMSVQSLSVIFIHLHCVLWFEGDI